MPGPSLSEADVDNALKTFHDSEKYTALIAIQLDTWQKLTNLTTEQEEELSRLQSCTKVLQTLNATVIRLAEDYRPKTIDAVMSRSDEQLGLEALLNGFFPKRH